MKIGIISPYGQGEIHEMKAAPRIGDTVILFHKPWPKVTTVAWLPGKLTELPLSMQECDCVVTVE